MTAASFLPTRRAAAAVLAALGALCLPPAQASTHPVSALTQAPVRVYSEPAPLAQVLRYKMRGPLVRELQIRLRHAKYLARYDATDRFDANTRESLRRFQRDQGLPVTGELDQASWDALRQRSFQPTAAELGNVDVGPWYTAPTQPGFVRELQHRLRQAGLYQGPRDGQFNDATGEAVAAFRTRVGLPASPVMDERTWARLIKRTRAPRYTQLYGDAPQDVLADAALAQELDPRCLEGKVVCISKAQKRMSLVVDGKVLFTREARFARPGWDSPEGEFRIWYMNQDTISTLFGERTPMPYAIFYDGNVAIHYSDDFSQVGYQGGSHGCSQLRDYQIAHWLFEQVRVGDKVVVC